MRTLVSRGRLLEDAPFFQSEVHTRGPLNSSRKVCYRVSGTRVSAGKGGSVPTTTSVLGGG
jgi:hypothetical protein